MSTIVLSIVSLATGTIVNNVCDHITDRLKHGDCTDEKCRQLIARELDEIKTKLNGLARKDLQSSVCFFKDGLCLLNNTFEDTANDSESRKTENKLGFVKECLDFNQSEDLPFALTEPDGEELHSQISVFNKALARSSQTLTVSSKERFSSAKLSFENAYSKATEAFNNEALSTTERILATKLRIVSKMLQCLEDPDMAIAFSKLYLQQLHELPAIRKRFAVFFRNKVKSKLSKKKRGENIRCVMELSYALYEYAKLFAKAGLEILANWPKIKLRRKAINPLLVPDNVLKRILRCGVRSPNQLLFDKIDNFACTAVNSKGEIVAKSKNGYSLEVLTKDGEIVGSFAFDSEIRKGDSFEILALATALDDSIYAVTRNNIAATFYYTLHVFDADLDHVLLQFSLECLTGAGESHHTVCLAVGPNKNILVTKQDEAKVFVFDHNGLPKCDFALRGWNLIKDIKISARRELVVAELVGKTVGIYTEDGDLQRDIALPGLHKVCGLAFDSVEDTAVVLTEVLTGSYHEFRLLSYSDCGELLQSLVLPRQKEGAGYRITSHPNGPLAVVHQTGVIFLHH